MLLRAPLGQSGLPKPSELVGLGLVLVRAPLGQPGLPKRSELVGSGLVLVWAPNLHKRLVEIIKRNFCNDFLKTSKNQKKTINM